MGAGGGVVRLLRIGKHEVFLEIFHKKYKINIYKNIKNIPEGT
jgi:hypothetical protein